MATRVESPTRPVRGAGAAVLPVAIGLSAVQAAPEAGGRLATIDTHARTAAPGDEADRAAAAALPTLTPAAIEQALTGIDGARLSLDIDAAWARLFLLPWAPALRSAARWRQLALSRFVQRYDCAAEDWEVRVLPAWPPHPRLVVALPRALLDACRRGAGKRLAHLEIGLLRTLAETGAQAPRHTGCLIEVDAAQAWVMVFERGVLVRVRARRERDPLGVHAAAETEWAAHRALRPAAASAPTPASALAPAAALEQCVGPAWRFGPRAQALGFDRHWPGLPLAKAA